MNLKYYSILIAFLSLSFGTLTEIDAQPIVRLRNLEPAPNGTYRIVPNANGVPGWVQDTVTTVSVNTTPIGFVPTTTGNSSNFNQVVTDPNGEVWIIDADGDAVQMTTTVTGSETSVTAGSNITVTGTGSGGDPYIINASASGAGGTVSYSAGSGATVVASGANITFTKDAGTGEYTFNIPADVVLYEAVVDGDISDDDGNGEIFVAFNYLGVRAFNNDLTDAWRPHVWVWESGGSAPSRSSPKNVQQVTVQGISSVGSSDLEIVLQNVTTITPNPVFQFKF
jgi:hypothetical protein